MSAESDERIEALSEELETWKRDNDFPLYCTAHPYLTDDLRSLIAENRALRLKHAQIVSGLLTYACERGDHGACVSRDCECRCHKALK